MKDLPLVLIHGYPFDHTLWFPVVAALGSGVKTLLPDLPGFGSAPVLEVEPSIEAYADHVVAHAQSYGVQSAVVAGMSLGGYVALAIAEKYPDFAQGLGLISTQATADTDEARAGRAELAKKIAATGVQAAIDAALPKMFSAANEKNSDLIHDVQNGATKAGPAGLIWALRAMASRPDWSDFVVTTEKPVLIAHGSDDKFIPVAKARAVAENIRNITFAALKGAGHATPLESPDALAAALLSLRETTRQLRADRAKE